MSESATARQRREAWGSLWRLPSKRWQARFNGPDGRAYSARTEDGKPLTFLTKGDARAWLNRTHDAIARGVWEPPEVAARRRQRDAEAAAVRDVTFGDYAGRWLERIRTEPGKGGRMRKPGTVTMYRGRVNDSLLEPLGERRVRDIDTDVVRELTKALVALPSELRPGVKHNGVASDAIDALEMIPWDDVRDGILPTMPDVVTLARRSVRHDQDHSPEDDVATPAQVDALYAAVPQPWEAWGWRLHRKPSGTDKQVIQLLRIPLNENDAEFEAQLLGLARLLVYFLNEADISQGLPKVANEKWISKLERFLRAAGYAEVDRDVELLRRIQNLRSRIAAHTAGSGGEAFLAGELKGKSKREYIVDLMQQATQMLADLVELRPRAVDAGSGQ